MKLPKTQSKYQNIKQLLMQNKSFITGYYIIELVLIPEKSMS